MDNNLIIQELTNELIEENKKLLNLGDVTITVHTLNKSFTSSKMKLNDINTPLVVALLNNPKLFIHLKLPLNENKFLVLTKDVISNAVFEIEFFYD